MTDDDIADLLRRELHSARVPFDPARADEMIGLATAVLPRERRGLAMPLAAAAAVVAVGGGAAYLVNRDTANHLTPGSGGGGANVPACAPPVPTPVPTLSGVPVATVPPPLRSAVPVPSDGIALSGTAYPLPDIPPSSGIPTPPHTIHPTPRTPDSVGLSASSAPGSASTLRSASLMPKTAPSRLPSNYPASSGVPVDPTSMSPEPAVTGTESASDDPCATGTASPGVVHSGGGSVAPTPIPPAVTTPAVTAPSSAQTDEPVAPAATSPVSASPSPSTSAPTP